MREVMKAPPDVEQAKVTSAVHRLKELGVLRIHHELVTGFIYNIAPGAARPTDGRGRPRKHETITCRLESSRTTQRTETPRLGEPSRHLAAHQRRRLCAD